MQFHLKQLLWTSLFQLLTEAFAAPIGQPTQTVLSTLNISAGGVEGVMQRSNELARLEKFIDSILPSLLENELKNISFHKSFSMTFTTSFEKTQSPVPTQDMELPSFKTARHARELKFEEVPLIIVARRNVASPPIYVLSNNASSDSDKHLISLILSELEADKISHLTAKFITTAASATDAFPSLTTTPSEEFLQRNEFLDALRASFASNHALHPENSGIKSLTGEYGLNGKEFDASSREHRNPRVEDQDKRQLKTLKMQGYFPGAVTEVKDMSDVDLISLLRHYFTENKGQTYLNQKNKDEHVGGSGNADVVTLRPPDYPSQQKIRYGYRQKPKNGNDYIHHEQRYPSEEFNKYLPRIYPKPTPKAIEINEKDPLVKFITVIVSEVIKTLQAKNSLGPERAAISTSSHLDLGTTDTAVADINANTVSSTTTEEPKSEEDICDERMKILLPEIQRILTEKLSTLQGIQEFQRGGSQLPFDRSKTFPHITNKCMRRFEDYIGLMTELALERAKNRGATEKRKNEEKQKFDSLYREQKDHSAPKNNYPVYADYSQNFKHYYLKLPTENYYTVIPYKVEEDYKSDEDYRYIIPNPWPKQDTNQ